jgi:chemotaxis protein histidine kinase CheA
VKGTTRRFRRPITATAPQATVPAAAAAPGSGSGSRHGVPADSPRERQRFVEQVLDLMLRAESGLLQSSAGHAAVTEAVRAIDAVRAMAAFVGLTQVVRQIQEFEPHLHRLRLGSDRWTASDLPWLLRAIDRIRMLAVDPYRGPSEETDDVINLPVARLERLTALAEELHTRLAKGDDHRLTSLAAELQTAALGLYLLPLRPVCQRISAAAQASGERLGRPVQVRFSGDDQVIERNLIALVEESVTAVVTAAVEHGGASAPHLVFAVVSGFLVVRVAHEGNQPEDSLSGVRQRLQAFGGALDAEPGESSGTRIIMRLPREPTAASRS